MFNILDLAYRWGQNCYIPPFFRFGDLVSVSVTGNFTASNIWGN